MRFLIDTDICSGHLRNLGRIGDRFVQHAGRLCLSALSLAELYTWVFRAKSSPRHMDGLTALVSDMAILDVDHEIARRFGQMRANMLDHGQVVPTVDLLIAATALVHGLVMVTHNTRHFAEIPGLTLEDWLVE